MRHIDGPRFTGRRARRQRPGAALALDWAGHTPAIEGVPAQRRPGGDALADPEPPAAEADPAAFDTPMARMLLARARARAAIALDVIAFTAACPACGQDCEWIQERQDTRVRSTMDCPCVTGS